MKIGTLFRAVGPIILSLLLSAPSAVAQAAFGVLALSISIPNASAQEISHPEIPSQGVAVELNGGGKIILYEKGGEYYTEGDINSQNGTYSFEGTTTIDGVVFKVVSNNVDKGEVSLDEYKSKIGIDYSMYGNMGNNFLVGESEFLLSIEKIIETKPENRKERIRLAGNRMWKRALNDVYNSDGEKIKGGTLNLFLKKTPNMVESWKRMKGIYGDIYENQQVTRENQQVTRENQQLISILNKLGK